MLNVAIGFVAGVVTGIVATYHVIKYMLNRAFRK